VIPLFDTVPTRRFPVVTVALIVANLGVWLWELGAQSARIDHYAFYPCAVQGPCFGAARDHLAWPEGVLTGMFLHASWLHVLGNMLFLWIFGNNVEDVLGRVRFLLFYIVAGYVAVLAQTWITLHTGAATDGSIPTVGASGAIAGVLGAYFVLLPRARVVTLVFGFIPVPIPAVVFLGLWFVLQLWFGGSSFTHPNAGGGVAFFAHVGGFAFGAIAVRMLAVRSPLKPRK